MSNAICKTVKNAKCNECGKITTCTLWDGLVNDVARWLAPVDTGLRCENCDVPDD